MAVLTEQQLGELDKLRQLVLGLAGVKNIDAREVSSITQSLRIIHEAEREVLTTREEMLLAEQHVTKSRYG